MNKTTATREHDVSYRFERNFRSRREEEGGKGGRETPSFVVKD